jgi:hypothetical protein
VACGWWPVAGGRWQVAGGRWQVAECRSCMCILYAFVLYKNLGQSWVAPPCIAVQYSKTGILTWKLQFKVPPF